MKTLSDIEDENESTERRHTNRPEQSNIVDPQAEERALAEDDNELPFMPGALLEVRRVKTILDFSMRFLQPATSLGTDLENHPGIRSALKPTRFARGVSNILKWFQ